MRQGAFEIGSEELKSIVGGKLDLGEFGGIQGIARGVDVSLENGVSTRGGWPHISERREFYGSNGLNEKKSNNNNEARRSFLMLLWVKLHAFILFCKNYLTAEDKKKKNINIYVKVVRDGRKYSVRIGQLVVGDIVLVYTGDRVPADGIFFHGRGLSVLEPSLKGEDERVEICSGRPHLVGGSIVLSGSAKMLVTSVSVKEQMKMRLPYNIIGILFLKMFQRYRRE